MRDCAADVDALDCNTSRRRMTGRPPVLVAPDAAARRHSARLCAGLRTRLRARGWLGFDDFMQAALYAPGLGYYQNGLLKFGRAQAGGDFVTAATIGDLTARCLARQCAEVLADSGGDILEVGGGDGRMAADILAALARDDALPRRYFLLETSAELRARQRRAVDKLPAPLKSRARWLEALPRRFTGVILAVEALDAMPAMRFEIDAQGRALALGVALGDGEGHSDCDGDGDGDVADAAPAAFRWATAGPLPAALQRRVAGAAGEPPVPGYRGEIGLQAQAWTRTLGGCLRRGALLVIDYGFPRREFYHPQRRDGTLMCHYRHIAHADPFFYPGLQDISVHVDFTAVAEAAADAGLALAGFTSQGAFLLALGVLDMVDAERGGENNGGGNNGSNGNSAARGRARAGELARLTLPHEMGELFKVAAFTRNCRGPLTGFRLRDRRAALRAGGGDE